MKYVIDANIILSGLISDSDCCDCSLVRPPAVGRSIQ